MILFSFHRFHDFSSQMSILLKPHCNSEPCTGEEEPFEFRLNYKLSLLLPRRFILLTQKKKKDFVLDLSCVLVRERDDGISHGPMQLGRPLLSSQTFYHYFWSIQGWYI